MTPPPLPDAGQIEAIWERDLRPTLTAPSQDDPRMVILGGPQGSRKTTMRTAVPQQLGIADPVVLDGDDVFAYLPGYARMAREDGMLAAMRHFSPVAGQLTERVRQHAIDHRQNIVLVGPHTGIEYTSGVVQKFSAAGYRCELAYTAMHPAMSELGVMHRYQEAIGPSGIGYAILPPLEMQATVYANVGPVLAAAKSWPGVEAIHVADPIAGRIADSQRRQADGGWPAQPDQQQVLEETRHQLWSAPTRELFDQWRAEAADGAGDQWPERLASVDRKAAAQLADYRDVPDADLSAGLAYAVEQAAAARRQVVTAQARVDEITASLAPGGAVQQSVAVRADQVDAILQSRTDAVLVEHLADDADRTRRQADAVEQRLEERGLLGRPAVRGDERQALEQQLSDLRAAGQDAELRLAAAREQLEASSRLAGPASEHEAVLAAWHEAGGTSQEVLARTTAARERGLGAARTDAAEAGLRVSDLGTAAGLIQREMGRRDAQPPAQRLAEDAQRVQAVQRTVQQQTQQYGAGLGQGQRRSGLSR
ncbi:zeta toxin family protein [Kitasatospora sp. NPDC059160]|uniref:zeta toxin family protein n=1 Tax=Kitasatospora sp. NPDC059160 TaxID=3346748 RepID=UPI0036AC240D